MQTTLCPVLGKLRRSCLRSSEVSILLFLLYNRYTTRLMVIRAIENKVSLAMLYQYLLLPEVEAEVPSPYVNH